LNDDRSRGGRAHTEKEQREKFRVGEKKKTTTTLGEQSMGRSDFRSIQKREKKNHNGGREKKIFDIKRTKGAIPQREKAPTSTHENQKSLRGKRGDPNLKALKKGEKKGKKAA